MPWVYRQRTGEFYGYGFRWRGYSGKGPGTNNPNMVTVKDVGPIPVGEYEIGAPHFSHKVGPYALYLTPKPGTNTFGRSDFLIHGDKKGDPGNASKGCIILKFDIRQMIWKSGKHTLEVIE